MFKQWIKSFFEDKKPPRKRFFIETTEIIQIATPEEQLIEVYSDICTSLFEATQELPCHGASDTRKAIINVCEEVSTSLSDIVETAPSVRIAQPALMHLSISESVIASNQQQLTEIDIINFIKQHMKHYIELLTSQSAASIGGQFLITSIELIFENLPLLGLDTGLTQQKMYQFISLLSETWLALDKRQQNKLKALFKDPKVQALFYDLEYYLERGLKEKSQRERIFLLGKREVKLSNAIQLCKQVRNISESIRETCDLIVIPSGGSTALKPSRFYKENSVIINEAMDTVFEGIYKLASINQKKGLSGIAEAVFKPKRR